MTSTTEQPIPVFIPPLSALLLRAEDLKGEPLTKDETLAIRDSGACIMMLPDELRKMEESRGYKDVDPENLWFDWQMRRRELGREPDLDPGPRLSSSPNGLPGYEQTIVDAQDSLDRFRFLLRNHSTGLKGLIKTRIVDGESSVLMWLACISMDRDGFVGELFEVPDILPNRNIGDHHTVPNHELLDWMINDNGLLYGGFSLRHHRANLSEKEQQEFDEYVGVTRFA